jgi:hypothetical protein
MTERQGCQYKRVPCEEEFELLQLPTGPVADADESQPKPDNKAEARNTLTTLFWVSVGAAVLHSVCFVAIFIVEARDSKAKNAFAKTQVSLTDRKLRWEALPMEANTSLSASARASPEFSGALGCARVMGHCYDETKWFNNLQLKWCMAAWHLFSVVEHCIVAYASGIARLPAATLDATKYANLWGLLVTLRWASYAATAPLMMACIYVFGYNITEWLTALFIFCTMYAVIVGGGLLPDLSVFFYVKTHLQDPQDAQNEDNEKKGVHSATSFLHNCRLCGVGFGLPLVVACFVPLWSWFADFASRCNFDMITSKDCDRSSVATTSSCPDRAAVDSCEADGKCSTWINIVFWLLLLQTLFFLSFPMVWAVCYRRANDAANFFAYFRVRLQEELGFAALSFISKFALSMLVGALVVVREGMIDWDNAGQWQAIGIMRNGSCHLAGQNPGELALYAHAFRG